MPGLLPFRLGAFAAAAEAGAPVVPVTIRGTRAILSAETAFPRRGAINVIVGAPIFPQGQDWSALLNYPHQATCIVRTALHINTLEYSWIVSVLSMSSVLICSAVRTMHVAWCGQFSRADQSCP